MGAAPAALAARVQDDASDAPLLTPDQLDDLVSPIALYPDPLIAQVLAASTYPLEVVQADRWVQANPNLQGTALTDAAQGQPWDPSVQALVIFPSVLSMMDKNLTWTTDLGNAFLAQEQDVMDAVQRQRQSAARSGNLASNQQQTVQNATESGKTVIVIQPAQPQVIYVPVYNPVVIWGAPRWHPWPPYWYPPRPRVGIIIGTGPFGFFFTVPVTRYFHTWGGWNSWGWGCGWGGRNVVINNNFYIMNNYRPPQGVLRNGRTAWAHNPNHRAGVPYPNRGVARRVGAPVPRPRPQPINGPGGRPGGGAGGRPGAPPPRPGAPSIQPVRPGPGNPPPTRPGTPPNRPGGGAPSIQPAPGPGDRPSNRPGNRPSPDQPMKIQPAPGPGTPAARPGTRKPDRSALGDVNTPGNRAQIERDRGYGSMGDRATPRPATRPNTQTRSAPQTQNRPAPQSKSAPQTRPAPGKRP
ncbi:MAG TPA: DUF3300 domain-containing protein [Candidatus Acidoferrales bacterium]|nr:DUF3300 domain-containing protein [Candidatus Acidoferrales bacterium]